MDNKELPQEIMNEIIGLAIREIDLGYHDGSELPAFADGLGKGAQIAQSHYEPQLQAKDTTIKEQEAELERVKGLLKELHANTWQMSGKPRDIGWEQYCIEHNITP